MVKSIVVVGGGSAGWITANLLNAHCRRAGRQTQITLVESPDIPTIGVGEATVPSIRRTLSDIGLPEQELLISAEATFKTLIRYKNWNLGDSYDHPFDRRRRPLTDGAVRRWTAQNNLPFDRSFSALSQLADNHISPKSPRQPQYQGAFPYAYHLDAIKLANRLASFGRERGIQHKLCKVTDVKVSPEGLISAVHTDQGEALTADLYVDCTGFRAALLGGGLGVKMKSFAKHLLCNRAVTMRIPYEVYKPERIVTYTQAIARDHGWQWDINLQTRRGIGYVYSSDFLSEDAAETALRQNEGPHSDGLEARHIRFTSGKRLVSWKGNCVAVGLADGFLEPLESSGLYLVEFAGRAIATMLDDFATAPQATARYYNRIVDELYDEILGFLNLHYVTSKRRDTPFWQAVTADDAILDDLRDRLELWKRRSPTEFDFPGADRLFAQDSYEFILHGMKYVDGPVSGAPAVPDMSALISKSRSELPDHEAILALVQRAAAARA
ncbi:tryptophan halogenase family protein [Hyphomonas johnsonii]|uniref:Tryptophan halogenase n=1 Tax=Hyphomonas johnsonii MHS-2 TaxID=1280950 RepID=A0A059FP76_9PROT|nr:tryptophan halogenase family protein [Hyphomonas johnsonii]KCZ92331.1 tryptophan halogenase [Hyphomonas johnsonii MHS-2]